MFGFLKQKIADFGKKLKQTAEKEEAKQGGAENPPEKEKKHEEKKAAEEKKEIQAKKEEHTRHEEKKEDASKQAAKTAETKEPKKEEKPIKAEEKKQPEKEHAHAETKQPEEKKKGFFGKLFGGKKKEEKATAKEEHKAKAEEKGKKKKTKEEIAAELEAKMFREIEGELKKEGADVGEANATETAEENEETDEITKEATKGASKEEEKVLEKDKLHAEKIKEDVAKEKETLAKRMYKTTLEKAAHADEKTEAREVGEAVEKELDAEEELAEEVQEETRREAPRNIHITTLEEDKRELKAAVGAGGKLKGFLFGGIEITEKQIEDLLWELELSLIESDVEQDAAAELVRQIKQRLVGKKVSSKNLDDYLKEQIKEILTEMMSTERIDLLAEAKKHKPLKILMLGPNGAGKTTSIAKLVHYFKKHKLSSIVAAGDTFRAGAIDQIEEHARRLDVRVIKQQYGADPAAVSFDAIKAAEAWKIDVVLIDSAGRQETNKNLMEELRKIERVAKPDLKIYVGEAYVGQALLDQVQEFKEMIGIDGFILTKIDTDAKGGTAISLLYKMKKPIIFVGTGQGYDDFKEFTPEFVLERII